MGFTVTQATEYHRAVDDFVRGRYKGPPIDSYATHVAKRLEPGASGPHLRLTQLRLTRVAPHSTVAQI